MPEYVPPPSATTPLSTPPSRLDPSNFEARSDQFLGQLPLFQTQQNSQASYVYDRAVQTAALTEQAAGFRDTAATHATSAQAAAAASAASANFKGLWSSLSGALNKPASVEHNGKRWDLLNNLANVAASQPGVSADWLESFSDKASLTGNNTFAGRQRISRASTALGWNDAQLEIYTPPGSSTDFSRIAFHVQDANNAPQFGYHLGVGRIGWFSASGANLFTTDSGGGDLQAPGSANFGAGVGAQYFRATSAYPTLEMQETDGPVDRKNWRWSVNGGSYRLEVVNDAYSAVVMTPVIFDQNGGTTFTGSGVFNGNLFLNQSGVDAYLQLTSNAGATQVIQNTSGDLSLTNYVAGRGMYFGQAGPGLIAFYLNGVEVFRLPSDGTTRTSGGLFVGTAAGTGEAKIEVGGNRTGNGISYIDFVSIAGHDYSARIAREGLVDGYLVIENNSNGVIALGQPAVSRLTIGCGDGRISAVNSVGFGYGSGSGGSVTQVTSKSTSVTLNKPSGRITTHDQVMNTVGDTFVFTLNNSCIGVADVVVLTTNLGNGYRLEARTGTSGSCQIDITLMQGASRQDAIQINFVVIKGSTV